jgi:hypothetical protein
LMVSPISKSEVPRECRDSSLPGVLGVSPNSLFPPKTGGSKGVQDLHASMGSETDRTGVISY